MWLGEPAEPTPDEAVLAEAITHRHTNRRPFDERPVPPELTLALVRAAAAEGAWLEAVADPERKRSLAGLVAQAHAEQLADEAFVGELASWVRDPAAEDGMPTHGVPLDEVGAPHASAFLRTFEAAAGAAATEAELTAGSPLLAVLGTTEDDEAAWLRCGEALGHVLLRACAEGLSASFLNQPIEVASLRPQVAPAIGHGRSRPRPAAPRLRRRGAGDAPSPARGHAGRLTSGAMTDSSASQKPDRRGSAALSSRTVARPGRRLAKRLMPLRAQRPVDPRTTARRRPRGPRDRGDAWARR